MNNSNVNTLSDERVHMKQFISAALTYNKTKSEEAVNVLSRKLQLLGVSLDVNTFDSESSVVAEFFVSLHELLSGLESRSPLVWFSVSVLQQACRNQTAHRALIHTYQFLPILARLLGDHLTRDKKRKLLALMQELTYGINISWQISYLPHLLTTLTGWIETSDEELTTLSLGVLLNLCYKNLPVIYTLMRTINMKQFLRMIMAMKNPATEVQVCKLLIVLEHISGQVPNEDILNFVRVTFKTIVEAFEGKDLIRLRHIVQFFLEVHAQPNRLEAVLIYDRYYEDVTRILDSLESNKSCDGGDNSGKQLIDLECIGLLFEFISSLVQLHIVALRPLYARIVRLTLGWIQTETVCSKALALLKNIAMQTEATTGNEEYERVQEGREEENIQHVLEPLTSGLTIFLHIIDSTPTHVLLEQTEQCRKVGALFQLLRSLVQTRALHSTVLATLKQSSVLKVLEVLFEGTNAKRNNDEKSVSGFDEVNTTSNTTITDHEMYRYTHTFSTDLIEMHLHALALMSALATYSQSWEMALLGVYRCKQVHAVLAQAFITDAYETKMLVFEMATVRNFPLKPVARIMCELQKPRGIIHADTSPTCSPSSQLALLSQSTESCAIGLPVITCPQVEQLDQVIGRLKDALVANQVGSVATSEVMELYEYKVAAMAHAERAAQSSLEAANQHATHLQHRLAQMSTEVSRLHQLLFHTQQCQEETQKQYQHTSENLKTLTIRYTKEQVRGKELSEQLSDKVKALENQVQANQILETKLNELIQNNNYLSKKYEDQVNKNIALVKASAAIETNARELERKLEDKTDIVLKSKQQNDALKTHIQELEVLCKQHENTIFQKEKELTETHKLLEENQRILDTITKLTTKTNS